MALTPLAVERFGPLNLVADPQEVGALGAIDMLDVDLDQQGRVRCRDGYAKWTTSTLAGDVMSLAAVPTPGDRLLAWAGGSYYAIPSTGTPSGPSTSTPAGSTVPPMFLPGVPDSLATLDTAGHIMVWNSGWTDVDISASVDAADEWSVITRTPVSNRVVLTGGATLPDRVVFSDPGASFSAGNFVDVTAEDGDATIGAAVYRDLTIVFKGRRFAVFYGESTDADGGAIFNYRTSTPGSACRPAGAVARDGRRLLRLGRTAST
jgi:hypothetical protein